MGRSTKQGFDYFPWDVDGIDEIHLDMCMDEFGSDAYTMFHFILSKIYRDKGYYVIRDKAFDFAASRKLRVDRERINKVMESLEENELIITVDLDGKKYITSEGIQKQFIQLRKDCKRSGDFGLIPQIWLLKGFAEISSEEIGRNPKKSPKVKESKVKENKEQNSTVNKTDKKENNESNSDSETDSDSDYFSPMVKTLIGRLKSEGLDVKPNTVDWLKWMVKEFDESFINDTVEEALTLYREGKVYNPIGYIRNKVDETSYTIPFKAEPKRRKPDPDCPICHGDGGFFRKTILNGVEGAGEWVQCECTKPLQDVKEM